MENYSQRPCCRSDLFSGCPYAFKVELKKPIDKEQIDTPVINCLATPCQFALENKFDALSYDLSKLFTATVRMILNDRAMGGKNDKH